MTVHWGEKRYYSLDYYLKKTYGEKLYKISLDGGMTCPNRDGTLGTHGCIFCSRGGSGDFADFVSRFEQVAVCADVDEPAGGTAAQSEGNLFCPNGGIRRIFS